MVDWSQYGFEEYAETFDSLGLKSLGDLYDVAPELEEMGLVGLCEALGIPKNKTTPVSEPAPVPRQKTQSEIESDRRYHKTQHSLLVICIALIGVMVLLACAVPIAARLGLIKSNLYVTLPSDSDLHPSGVGLILVDTERKNRVYSAPFSSDGTGTLEVRRGEYELYLSYDDQVYGTVDYSADGTHDTYLELDLKGLLIRPVIVSFFDKRGNPLTPQSITVSVDGDTTAASCELFTDTEYLFVLSNDIHSPMIEFTIEGYEPVQLQYDFGSNRVSILEVTLYEKD